MKRYSLSFESIIVIHVLKHFDLGVLKTGLGKDRSSSLYHVGVCLQLEVLPYQSFITRTRTYFLLQNDRHKNLLYGLCIK